MSSASAATTATATAARKQQTITVNLTPHDITVLADMPGSKTGLAARETYVPYGPVVRATGKKRKRIDTTEDGVPLVAPPDFDGVSDLPDEVNTEEYMLIMSTMAAEALLAKRPDFRAAVVVPDTGPESVVRDAKGQIKGVRRFIEMHNPKRQRTAVLRMRKNTTVWMVQMQHRDSEDKDGDRVYTHAFATKQGALDFACRKVNDMTEIKEEDQDDQYYAPDHPLTQEEASRNIGWVTKQAESDDLTWDKRVEGLLYVRYGRSCKLALWCESIGN